MKRLIAVLLILVSMSALASAIDDAAYYNDLLTGLWQEMYPAKDKEPQVLNINADEPTPGKYFTSSYTIFVEGSGQIDLVYSCPALKMFSISGYLSINADASQIFVIRGDKTTGYERIEP